MHETTTKWRNNVAITFIIKTAERVHKYSF